MNINLNQNVANPNFKAKLKDNEYSRKFINSLDDTQLQSFKETLTKLDGGSKGDVLEIRHINPLEQYSEKELLNLDLDTVDNHDVYTVFNTKNPKKSVRLTKTYDLHEKFDKFAVKDFLDVMSRIATIGTKENDKLLGQKENLKSKNVYDMLA